MSALTFLLFKLNTLQTKILKLLVSRSHDDSGVLNLHHGYYTTITTSRRLLRPNPVSRGTNQPIRKSGIRTVYEIWIIIYNNPSYSRVLIDYSLWSYQLEDRRTIDFIITKFFFLCVLKWRKDLEISIISYVTGRKKGSKKVLSMHWTATRSRKKKKSRFFSFWNDSERILGQSQSTVERDKSDTKLV